MQNEYYTIAIVSLTGFIPVIYGIIFSVIYSERRNAPVHLFGISFKGRQISAGVLRMFYIFILSFLSLLLLINFMKPVPQEGWLRTIFMITLLSAESAFTYSMIRLSFSRMSGIALLVLVLLLFAAMPFGLVLHKPWNHVMFISPFYWIGWAWIIPSPVESFSYTLIGAALSVIYLLAAGSYLRRKEREKQVSY